jgi:hypothetical protein
MNQKLLRRAEAAMFKVALAYAVVATAALRNWAIASGVQRRKHSYELKLLAAIPRFVARAATA